MQEHEMKWISVEESLPPEGVTILVHLNPYSKIGSGSFCVRIVDLKIYRDRRCKCGYRGLEGVDFWRHLPENSDDIVSWPPIIFNKISQS